jgi:prevent-host-death family protein
MKTVAAKDAKNRFGQLIDDAQRQPVTVEKNGRPFVVVQSFEDFQIAQQLKMASLRTAINEARAEYAEGREMPFDETSVERITTIGRRLLAKRDRNR